MKNNEPVILRSHVCKASKYNERAKLFETTCYARNCPLLKEGKCIHGFFSNCLYGKTTVKETVTKRANSYSSQLRQFEKEAEKKCKEAVKPEFISSPPICVIDDWVCLEGYSHVTLCNGVPWKSKGNALLSGKAWIKYEDFKVEHLVTICKFRPRSLMGGEIRSYQNEEVPRLLFHLKYMHPDWYKELISLEPSLSEREYNLEKHIPFKINAKYLPSGRYIDGQDSKCYVGNRNELRVVSWDNRTETLVVVGKPTNNMGIFDGIKGKMMRAEIQANENTEVTITSLDLMTAVVLKNPQLIGVL